MGLFRRFFGWLRHRQFERRRLLLAFWDGERLRYADPFRLWRDLQNHSKMNLADMAQFVDEGKEPETTIVIDGVAEVFGVKRWSEMTQTGLTDWEILNLIALVDDYLLALKKNISHGPTLSEPTASTS